MPANPTPGEMFLGPDGFRRVVCPLCGKTVNVTSWPDDIRHRYARHTDGGPDGENCDATDELLPPAPV